MERGVGEGVRARVEQRGEMGAICLSAFHLTLHVSRSRSCLSG